jgi:beta-lactamase class A
MRRGSMRRVAPVAAILSVAAAGCATSRPTDGGAGHDVDPAALPALAQPTGHVDGGVATGAAGPAGATGPGRAAGAGVPGTPTSSVHGHDRLRHKIQRYVRARPGRAGLVVQDLRTGERFAYRPRSQFVAASVMKVNVLVGLVLLRQQQHRRLSDGERSAAARMIRYSDNDAADALYRKIGRAAGLGRTNQRLGMRCTKEARVAWGASETCPADQLRLLQVLAAANGPVSPPNRDFIWGLMGSVTGDQAWGISAGARDGETVALKNGWTPLRHQGTGWAVHSVGRVRGGPRDLLIAIFTTGNRGHRGGIDTTQRLARLAMSAFHSG